MSQNEVFNVELFPSVLSTEPFELPSGMKVDEFRAFFISTGMDHSDPVIYLTATWRPFHQAIECELGIATATGEFYELL